MRTFCNLYDYLKREIGWGVGEREMMGSGVCQYHSFTDVCVCIVLYRLDLLNANRGSGHLREWALLCIALSQKLGVS